MDWDSQETHAKKAHNGLKKCTFGANQKLPPEKKFWLVRPCVKESALMKSQVITMKMSGVIAEMEKLLILWLKNQTT